MINIAIRRSFKISKKPGFFNNTLAKNKISYRHGDLRNRVFGKNPVSGGRIIIVPQKKMAKVFFCSSATQLKWWADTLPHRRTDVGTLECVSPSDRGDVFDGEEVIRELREEIRQAQNN
ncbi:MAG: hypothetical protein SXA11_09820 [Cyanobacteriota bacterium]|nr:hypothetical protein [Cyanobacteriota bacterium]